MLPLIASGPSKKKGLAVLKLIPSSPEDPLERFERARREMLAAWNAWLQTRPPRFDVVHEAWGTRSAMVQIADLRLPAPLAKERAR
jgi:hypothetical protein